ncbi:hypothetical protein ACFUGD_00175 [Streptomyces sp. NPDC057217]|uniref:hypothetical protein n=1 Tax=Streptomyces sp. NPDC057217 TaxID=3346054 RepID=UPI0036444070
MERTAQRAEQLTSVDGDWNCSWPLDWQRHHRVPADLVDADGVLLAIEPWVLFEGDGIESQVRKKKPGIWAQLLREQRERLWKLGVWPAQAPSPGTAAALHDAGHE